MPRPSKLSDKQWEAIGKRLLAGEKAAALAREFGVSKAAISQRFSERNETIKTVANQIVATEDAFGKLNVSEQFAARSLADRLKAISANLAGAAEHGAATAHRLASVANMKVQELDDSDPFSKESLAALKGVQVLTGLANLAAEIPMSLLKANKELITAANKGELREEEGIPTKSEYVLQTDEPGPQNPIL